MKGSCYTYIYVHFLHVDDICHVYIHLHMYTRTNLEFWWLLYFRGVVRLRNGYAYEELGFAGFVTLKFPSPMDSLLDTNSTLVVTRLSFSNEPFWVSCYYLEIPCEVFWWIELPESKVFLKLRLAGKIWRYGMIWACCVVFLDTSSSVFAQQRNKSYNKTLEIPTAAANGRVLDGSSLLE